MRYYTQACMFDPKVSDFLSLNWRATKPVHLQIFDFKGMSQKWLFKIIGDDKLILQFWSSYNSTVKLLNDYNLVSKFNFFRGINCTIFLKISAIYTTTET